MNCKFCDKPLSEKRIKEGGKFCNNLCYGKWMLGKPAVNPFKKGHKTWNKGKTGLQTAWNKGDKFPQFSGKNHRLYKGNNIKDYHKWVVKQKGKANKYKCNYCDKQASDWANIDHKYKRTLKDYIPMCRSCHRKFDVKHNNYKGQN